MEKNSLILKHDKKPFKIFLLKMYKTQEEESFTFSKILNFYFFKYKFPFCYLNT